MSEWYAYETVMTVATRAAELALSDKYKVDWTARVAAEVAFAQYLEETRGTRAH